MWPQSTRTTQARRLMVEKVTTSCGACQNYPVTFSGTPTPSPGEAGPDMSTAGHVPHAGFANMVVIQLGRGLGAQLGAVFNTTTFAASQVGLWVKILKRGGSIYS